MKTLKARIVRCAWNAHPKGEIIVDFYRDGTRYYPCKVALSCAHSDAYLRSLVRFMQHKVPTA